METQLRPLTLGEILDRTAQLYRSNFLVFAGIFAVYAGVTLLFNLIQLGLVESLRAGHLDKKLAWIPIATSAVEVLAIFLLIGAAIAAINRAVAWVHLGEPATIRGAYGSILPQLGRYLWLMTITAFIAWLPFALLYGAFIGVFVHYGPLMSHPANMAGPLSPVQKNATMAVAVAGISFLVLMFPIGFYTVWMSLRYALAVPVSVVENLKARLAIKRSVELTKGARGRIFVLLILVLVIKLGLVSLTQLFIFVAAFRHKGQLSAGLSALSSVISFFTNTFIGPIGATGITLFYYDQRVRKEGFDIEWMMRAAGLTAPTPETGGEDAGHAAEPRLDPSSTAEHA